MDSWYTIYIQYSPVIVGKISSEIFPTMTGLITNLISNKPKSLPFNRAYLWVNFSKSPQISLPLSIGASPPASVRGIAHIFVTLQTELCDSFNINL